MLLRLLACFGRLQDFNIFQQRLDAGQRPTSQRPKPKIIRLNANMCHAAAQHQWRPNTSPGRPGLQGKALRQVTKVPAKVGTSG